MSHQVDLALQEAINGNSQRLQQLFADGLIDVHKEAPFGYPLIFAAKLGDLELTRKLINNGADTGVTDNKGWAPLHWAAATTNADLVKLLLENNASPYVYTQSNKLPMDLAQLKNNPAIIKVFNNYLKIHGKNGNKDKIAGVNVSTNSKSKEKNIPVSPSLTASTSAGITPNGSFFLNPNNNSESNNNNSNDSEMQHRAIRDLNFSSSANSTIGSSSLSSGSSGSSSSASMNPMYMQQMQIQQQQQAHNLPKSPSSLTSPTPNTFVDLPPSNYNFSQSSVSPNSNDMSNAYPSSLNNFGNYTNTQQYHYPYQKPEHQQQFYQQHQQQQHHQQSNFQQQMQNLQNQKTAFDSSSQMKFKFHPSNNPAYVISNPKDGYVPNMGYNTPNGSGTAPDNFIPPYLHSTKLRNDGHGGGGSTSGISNITDPSLMMANELMANGLMRPVKKENEFMISNSDGRCGNQGFMTPDNFTEGAGAKQHNEHGERQCENCLTTQTPQWRRGPGGAVSLCNKCGLRYNHKTNKEVINQKRRRQYAQQKKLKAQQEAGSLLSSSNPNNGAC
eukprot:Awhi_evm1s14642